MTHARLLSRRDAVVWTVGFLAVATLIVRTGFTSADPDSSLYASLAARLGQEPVARWIAPEWWGFWPEAGLTGLFREHPAGVFLLPAALQRLGIPAEQGAYIVGVAAGLASLLLIGVLVRRLASRDDARAALVLMQVMPVAFIFRIRANHEYPMLVCLLLALLGLDAAGRRGRWWRAMALAGLGVTAGLFIKGVFVVMVLLAMGAWIAVNPTDTPGARARQVAVTAIAIAFAAIAALAYDEAYRAVTSQTFWGPYWARQLGPVTIATPIEGASTLVGHLVFYVSRVLWHPAPWSFALLVAAWRVRGRLQSAWHDLAPTLRGGLLFAIVFAAAQIVMLSPSNRFAERYAFSAAYAIAAAGAVAACHEWPGLAARLRRLDERIPAFPALLWIALMLLRLGTGPLLPRV